MCGFVMMQIPKLMPQSVTWRHSVNLNEHCSHPLSQPFIKCQVPAFEVLVGLNVTSVTKAPGL